MPTPEDVAPAVVPAGKMYVARSHERLFEKSAAARVGKSAWQDVPALARLHRETAAQAGRSRSLATDEPHGAERTHDDEPDRAVQCVDGEQGFGQRRMQCECSTWVIAAVGCATAPVRRQVRAEQREERHAPQSLSPGVAPGSLAIEGDALYHRQRAG